VLAATSSIFVSNRIRKIDLTHVRIALDPDRIRKYGLLPICGMMFPFGNEGSVMGDIIMTTGTLGHLIRASRIAQGLTRDELANATGLSPKFISQVEAGKPTAQFGKILQLLGELGISLRAETSFAIPSEIRQMASVRRRSPAPRLEQ
jgi:DNA-binding XRE family transcriptional regulator